jgi:hypothetical protein
MAGLAGNIGWIMGQLQSAKGTQATFAATKAWKSPFAGGDIGPVRETDNLSETDSSRDQGVAYVVNAGVEGEPEIYTRDGSAAFWLKAALGSMATAGTTDLTHTITPGATLPYITVWKNLSNTLYEVYRDCKVSTATFSAEAGSPLSMTLGIQGAKSTRLTADPDVGSTLAIESSVVPNFNNVTVTLGGGATAAVRSFELTIENNVQRQQTDDVEAYDVTEGTREVSLGFDLIFEDLTEYNKFHYGGAAGTIISPTIFTTSAIFDFSLGANNGVAFNLPSIAYQEFPVSPDPGGDPIVASVREVAQRSGSPVVTATVKNQSAAARYAA